MHSSKELLDESLVTVEEIYRATWEPVYRFIYYKVQNREEAEDIMQETYMKAIQYLQQGKIQQEKQLGFLKTVAMNVLRDNWRKMKRGGIKADLDNVTPLDVAIDDASEASTQKIVLEHALAMLTKEQRTIIELRILKGFSVFDTAKVMNKKEVTIRVMQHRALQRLAAILKKEEIFHG